jgi:hypothetical protein
MPLTSQLRLGSGRSRYSRDSADAWKAGEEDDVRYWYGYDSRQSNERIGVVPRDECKLGVSFTKADPGQLTI